MNVEIKGSKLIITMNLQEPKPSTSGKHLVVASSRGSWESAAEIAGRPVVVVANAFIAADEPPENGEGQDVEELDPSPKTKSRKGGQK